MKINKTDETNNFWKKIKSKIHSIKKNKNKYSLLEMIIAILIVFGIGLIIGGVVMYGKGSYSSSIALNEFVSTYDEIVNDYYQDVNKDELLEAGISGMIRYLGDPYSTYMNKKEAEDFNEDVEGTYQGIGAEIKYSSDNLPMFGKIFQNSPAEKAGIMENDILLEVNGTDVTKYDLSAISNIVKGEKGTSVKLIIKRNDEKKEIELIRDVVDNISVISEIINKNNKKIGYIEISTFAANTTAQFEKELKNIEKENIDSLIIDVRGNSGGYLDTATNIISMFVKKDTPIYELKTKEKIEIITDQTDEFRDYPIVVLADRNSASASELLVAALKENNNAIVVGTKTYGKGKVQKVTTLSSGALFKYTYQEWLTPKGNYIDQVGIEPDVEIKYEYSKEGKDNQKEKAIEVISK